MQIDSEISPIISPISNISNYFVSPRDFYFSHPQAQENIKNSNSFSDPNFLENLQKLQADALIKANDLEYSQNTNLSLTNQSCSPERILRIKFN